MMLSKRRAKCNAFKQEHYLLFRSDLQHAILLRLCPFSICIVSTPYFDSIGIVSKVFAPHCISIDNTSGAALARHHFFDDGDRRVAHTRANSGPWQWWLSSWPTDDDEEWLLFP